MPKGSSSYYTGGDMRVFKCVCEDTTRIFASQKQFDMFVRLHRKKCEKLKTKGYYTDYADDDNGTKIGLKQEISRSLKKYID